MNQWLSGLYGVGGKGVKEIATDIEQLQSKHQVDSYLLELAEMIK